MYNRPESDDFGDDPLVHADTPYSPHHDEEETELSPPIDDGPNENFKVAIRCRPPLPREMEGSRQFINVVRIPPDHKSIALCEHLETEDGRGGIFSTQTFSFDHVYDPSTSQSDVYDRSARSAVSSVLQGYNATLIAYGQTGTGKTFTMEGFTSDDNRGIIPRATENVFAHIQSNRMGNTRFLVRASYLQIYNENISDLLKPHNKQLVVRHTKQRGVYIEGLSEWVVRTPADVYGLMERGLSLRATGSTKMSELSSRSHAMFMIIVECMEGDENDPTSYRFGKLNIVDLAGSEKVRQTGVTGQRLKETQKINWSLHELGNVIAALADPKRRDKHVPFRNSCLTRALQDSLGGNCKTTLIACISPALESYHESLSTLKFANRAKNIKNEATVNEDLNQASLLRRYEKELQKLRQELQTRDTIINSGDAGGIITQLQSDNQHLEESHRAALAALEEKSRAMYTSQQEKSALEERIHELESVVNNGGVVGEGGPRESDEYNVRLEELDKERQVVEEDKAQVDRYKQLLLKQRDIMLNLTTRLNERDESILQLQEELEAYDAHIRMVEDNMQAQMPQMSTATEASSYLRSIRVDSKNGTMYRSEGNRDNIISAEDKITELLMLRGRAPISADEAFDRSDERRSMEIVLRDRLDVTATRAAGEKLASMQREIDNLRGQLDASEEKRRTSEYLASGTPDAERLRRYVEQEQEKVKANFSIRVTTLQNELDAERSARRGLSKELDKYRFDLSQVRGMVDSSQQHQIDSLYRHVERVEESAIQELLLTTPTTPSPSSSSGNKFQDPMAGQRQQQLESTVLSLRAQVEQERAGAEQSQKQLEEYKAEVKRLRSQQQQQQQTPASSEEVATLRRSLNTHIKDRNALKSIMEQRIKVKTDSIEQLLLRGAVPDAMQEAKALQTLVNASINAMSE